MRGLAVFWTVLGLNVMWAFRGDPLPVVAGCVLAAAGCGAVAAATERRK